MARRFRNILHPGPRSGLAANRTQAKFQRALALYQTGQVAQARTLFEEILRVQPKHCDALNILSLMAYQANDYRQAVNFLDRAITIQPSAAAYSNRGIALNELGQLEAAVASYDKAIALQPDYAVAHANRGKVLRELGQLEAAVAGYDRAVALQPDFAEAHYNRGNVLKSLTRLEAAVASYDKAIALRPDFAEAYWNKALVLLLGGHFLAGWELYEWRWSTEEKKSTKRNFPQPLWLGKESLEGKTILLHSEQGLGDMIQFCRYVKLVSDTGARVILEVPDSLCELLKQIEGLSGWVVEGSPLPQFDYYCPLLSLPLAFKTDLHSIPCAIKYLSADAVKVAHWAGRLGEKRKPRIGLAWSGSPTHKNDRNRSIGLATLMPHLPADYQYVSLQKDVRDSDKPALESWPNLLHFGQDLDDFTDTAALCELMDVVISVDTSVAHLSGALGKPTWILLPFSPDWRWLLERGDSPWYPTVRLYRQPRVGEWDSVFMKVIADLTKRDRRSWMDSPP